MKKLILGALLSIMAIPALAETVLLNFHNPKCSHCVAFEQEIGKEGFEADPRSNGIKMVVLNFDEVPPAWLQKEYGLHGSIQPVRGTPCFVLYDMDEKKEIGRFVGYMTNNPNFFWSHWEHIAPM